MWRSRHKDSEYPALPICILLRCGRLHSSRGRKNHEARRDSQTDFVIQSQKRQVNPLDDHAEGMQRRTRAGRRATRRGKLTPPFSLGTAVGESLGEPGQQASRAPRTADEAVREGSGWAREAPVQLGGACPPSPIVGKG